MDKNGKKIKEAEKADIPIVSEDYLDTVKKEEALAAISKHSLVSWGAQKVSDEVLIYINMLADNATASSCILHESL